MAAPLAAFMRLSAIDPEASTTKMTSEPALRAIFFARTSLCSMYTPFSFELSFDSAAALCALSRRFFWYGAAVRIVASTASLRTRPRGRIGLIYRPRSSEKIIPRAPELPDLALLVNFMTSGSSATPSTSNMNSSGTGGAASSCSSCSGSSSFSGSWSCSSSSSCSWFCGGGGGGGACIMSSSGGAWIWVPRGAMARRTPI
mmetsp:Transcript_11787/g.14957  ORF Transcript_11787/g.14957 Transcript_11787/m.14957 type:complete len:201 (+) Transcript_11787:1108-1710(+)